MNRHLLTTSGLLALLWLSSEPVWGEEFILRSFRKIRLSDQFFSEGAGAGDFNRDGKTDVVIGPFWYEGPDFRKKHEIYPPKPHHPLRHSDNFHTFVHDLNGDDWDDVLVVRQPGREAVWFANPQGKEQHWLPTKALNNVANESPLLADLTGDGRPELVYNFRGHMGWAEPNWNEFSWPWEIHKLSPNVRFPRDNQGLGIGDINGDGRMDVIERTGWWEQPESLKGDPEWVKHPYVFTPRGGAQMHVYDVDGDGDNDVITSLDAHGFGLAWFEQIEKDEQRTFVRHQIMGVHPHDNRYGVKFSQLHALALADLDGDGLKDIVTGKRYWANGPNRDEEPNAPAFLYWFKLVRGDDGVEFIPYRIDGDSGVGVQLAVADVNGDRTPDVIVGSKKGQFVFLQQKKAVTREEWLAAQPAPLSFDRFDLFDGDKVVFIGGGFIEQETRLGIIESMLARHLPFRRLAFRNIGWSGDDVYGEARASTDKRDEGYLRRMRSVNQIKPSVAFICYGANEAFDGGAGLDQFRRGLERLLNDLGRTGARLVLLSPPPHENLGKPFPDPNEYNQSLALYTGAIAEQAKKRGIPFIDLYHALIQEAKTPTGQRLTDDGLRFTRYGYQRAATIIAMSLGLGAEDSWQLELESTGRLARSTGTRLTNFRAEEGKLQWTCTDRFVMDWPTRATSRKLTIRGLHWGYQYVLKIDGRPITSAFGFDWEKGIHIHSGPDAEQSKKLGAEIQRKNELFFHHWRPQNEIYLTGHKRRREQDPATRELESFAGLIGEKENEIASLKVPAARSFELVQYDGRSMEISEEITTAKPRQQTKEAPPLILKGCKWIWYPKGDPLRDPGVQAPFFRKKLKIQAGRKIRTAEVLATADDYIAVYVNGQQVFKDGAFNRAVKKDISQWLKTGENVLAIEAANRGFRNAAGMIALFIITFENHEPVIVRSDNSWKTYQEKQDTWLKADHDETGWVPSLEIGLYGIAPWRELHGGGPAEGVDPKTESERRALKLAEGFEINLFASEPMIDKPIQMAWDAAGRLWVAATTTYPQLKPHQRPKDKIIILEDTDGDGRADKRTIFADNLLMPGGILPGDGGAYLANSTELLHLKDTDGDGRADRSRVVLSGFGNQDSSRLLHTLRRGPDGMIYMNQSGIIRSRIETPWGVRSLHGGGTLRMHPNSNSLEVFTRGMWSPWGHAVDSWGMSLLSDRASREGIHFGFEGAVFKPTPGARRKLRGINPGQPELSGIEFLSGRHLPPEFAGNLVAGEPKAHRVKRYITKEHESGYKLLNAPDLVWSDHKAFRPVDVKMGPDGALYIADWFDTIAEHETVNFRDGHRDSKHGRIWRLTYKERPLVERPGLKTASIRQLLNALKEPEQWTRDQARRRLHDLSGSQVVPAIRSWIRSLDSGPDLDRLFLEAMRLTEFHVGTVNNTLLMYLLDSKDHQVRAATVRTLSRLPQIKSPLPLLKKAATDNHHRVRLEAVNALRKLGTADAAETAMFAIDKHVDRYIDYALWLTATELEPLWLAKIQRGDNAFGGNMRHAAYAIRASRNPSALKSIVSDFRKNEIVGRDWHTALRLISEMGDGAAQDVLFELAFATDRLITPQRQDIIDALERAAARKKPRPQHPERLLELFRVHDEGILSSAARLAGRWQLEKAIDRLSEFALSDLTTEHLREAAIDGLAWIGNKRSTDLLVRVTERNPSAKFRAKAVIGLAGIDIGLAAHHAVPVLSDVPSETDLAPLIDAILRHEKGPEALAREVEGKAISKEVAILGIERARRGGSRMRPFTRAVSIVGKIPPMPQKLNEQELKRLYDDIRRNGDPAFGEKVFRRPELSCVKCHSIAGIGGRLGPDCTFIGRLVPMEQLVEALLEPHKKIAQGFQTLRITTKKGAVLKGRLISEGEDGVTFMSQDDKSLTFAASEIKEKKVEPESLMPEKLTSSLRPDEFADLVRFLLELGKGRFNVPNKRLVRRYRVLTENPGLKPDAMAGAVSPLKEPDRLKWSSAFSLVDGNLPLAELKAHQFGKDRPYGLVRFSVRVTRPGKIGVHLDDSAGLQLWMGNKKLRVMRDFVVNVPHTVNDFIAVVDLKARTAPLRFELYDVRGSNARPVYVGPIRREFIQLRKEMNDAVTSSPLKREMHWLMSHLDFLEWRTPENEIHIHPNHARWLRDQFARIERSFREIRKGKNPFPSLRGQLLKSYYSAVDDSWQTYAVSVPNDYTGEKAFPMIVTLHGHGGWRPFQGYPTQVRDGMIFVAPHARGAMDYMLYAEQDVLRVISEVQKDYNIDPDRIILEGHSMGGTGSWNLGAKFPDRFCCIAPGAGNTNNESFLEDRSVQWRPVESFKPLHDYLMAESAPLGYAENLGNLPTFCLHGALDRIVRVSHAQRMVGRMMEYSYEPIYREYPNVGHGGFPRDVVDERWNWLFKQKRNMRPKKVRFKTARLRYPGAYWVRIDQFERFGSFAEIQAEQIDEHKIHVKTDNVRGFSILTKNLHFAPEGRLEVSINDRKAFEGTPADELRLSRHNGSWQLYKKPEGLEKRNGLEGPVQDAFLSAFVLVYGTATDDSLWRKIMRNEVDQFADQWEKLYHTRPRIKADAEITDEDIKNLNLILYGGPKQNSISERLCASLPIKLNRDSILVGKREFRGMGIAARFCYPNPLNPNRYIVLSASLEPFGLWQLNNRFGNITGWVPLNNWNWFDYAVFDDRSYSADTMVCSGFFGPRWEVDKLSQWIGDTERRASSFPRVRPKLLELPEDTPRELWLSDLMPFKINQAKGVLNLDRSYLRNPLRIGNKIVEKGLGVRAPSIVEYSIESKYDRFHTAFGIDLEGEDAVTGERAKDEEVEFIVYGDDRRIWSSGRFRWNQQKPPVDLDIKGVHTLRLEVEGHGRVWLYGSTAWGNPKLLKAAGLSLIVQTIEKPKDGQPTSSHNRERVNFALDGNLSSRWDSGTTMYPGIWFIMDLKKEMLVKVIELDSANSPNDFPRGYEVYVTNDINKPGEAVAVGSGENGVTTIEIEKPVKGRFVKIIQTGSSEKFFWSIHELRVNP